MADLRASAQKLSEMELSLFTLIFLEYWTPLFSVVTVAGFKWSFNNIF
jgi:hypothetical protein